MSRERAPRNRTIEISEGDRARLSKIVVSAAESSSLQRLPGHVACGDAAAVIPTLSELRFDLLFADPPYNLNKTFGGEKFKSTTSDAYEEWLDSLLKLCVPLLTNTASV